MLKRYHQTDMVVDCTWRVQGRAELQMILGFLALGMGRGVTIS